MCSLCVPACIWWGVSVLMNRSVVSSVGNVYIPLITSPDWKRKMFVFFVLCTSAGWFIFGDLDIPGRVNQDSGPCFLLQGEYTDKHALLLPCITFVEVHNNYTYVVVSKETVPSFIFLGKKVCMCACGRLRSIALNRCGSIYVWRVWILQYVYNT